MPGVPLIGSDSSTATGVARSVYRWDLAETLGYFARGTVTTLATGLEAERYVVSLNVQSDQLPPEHWDGLWLSVTNGDEVGSCRRLQNGTFDGPEGAFYLDAPFDSGALALGTTFEVGVLPAESTHGITGSNRIINLALRSLPCIDYVPITLVANQTQYLIVNYAWPIKAIKAVIYPRTSTTGAARREVSPGAWTFDMDAEQPVLSFLDGLPGNAGDVIEVRVHRPADTRVRQNGGWGDTANGLTSDTDEGLYDATTVRETARPIALQRMSLAYSLVSKERGLLTAMAKAEETDRALAKFYGSFTGSGAQKAGARYGQRWPTG